MWSWYISNGQFKPDIVKYRRPKKFVKFQCVEKILVETQIPVYVCDETPICGNEILWKHNKPENVMKFLFVEKRFFWYKKPENAMKFLFVEKVKQEVFTPVILASDPIVCLLVKWRFLGTEKFVWVFLYGFGF